MPKAWEQPRAVKKSEHHHLHGIEVLHAAAHTFGRVEQHIGFGRVRITQHTRALPVGNQVKALEVAKGDGGIALIIEPQELIASAGAPGTAPLAPPVREPVQERRRVLVVEDSITSRTLLRNILEGAGYAVVTAVDGLDALERLAATEIDIVVSDVEMPRLDGFRLTARIRENYGRLPVILVTGREDAEDRRHGLEAGADAYLVKSRFDQGNLLEVIGRLT